MYDHFSLRNQSNLSNYQGVGIGSVTSNTCGTCRYRCMMFISLTLLYGEVWVLALACVIVSYCWMRHSTLIMPLQLGV